MKTIQFRDGLIIKLKECPFCGDENPDYEWNMGKYGDFEYIRCRACGARSRTVSGYRPNSREEVAAAWNIRIKK